MQKQYTLDSKHFEALTQDQKERLIKASQEKSFGKGETVFRRGEPGTHVWVVKTGRVHLQNVSYDGKMITSCVMTNGDMFCCLPAMDGKPYPADAVAAEPSTVLKISGEFIREMIHSNASFSREVICSFCDKLRHAEERGCQAFDPAEMRMARLLLTLGTKFNNQIPLTRQEMSEVAGLTVETTIRILSQMKKDGIIRSARRLTHVLHPEKLKELVEG
jgi:CRP/FNR family cyclic AMP-dependent transcriptional regulator